MNDDLSLSLYVDGRLPAEERAAFERRLDAEPALRARLDAMRRLQALSAGLAPASALFSADDVRVRAESRPHGGWRRLGLAAAAVLALAATHAAVFWAGTRKGAEAERSVRASIEATEALLDRTADMDIAAPPEQLRTEIATLRREIPTRLDVLSRARQPEAARLVDALREIDLALDAPKSPDPAFVCLQLKAIVTSLDTRAQVRFLPATATSYIQVFPADGGRFRVVHVEDVNGTPRTTVDEGTAEEIEARQGIQLRPPAAPKRR
ncbi:MAG TPA: hypothetical protein VFY93_17845 [Planctomycetota bacterium]|nr:hypothetical protein [Planctomycetota bacterium]